MDTIYDAKLLLVDDNAELLALLCEQLRGAGYGQKRMSRHCSSPHGTRMPTVCSGWVLAQMTT